MKKSEIVIIGAGVVGASVAFHLTERGAKDVLILESEAAQGLGSTGKATGGIRAQFETEINIRMSLYSLDFFKNWEIDCGYEPRGYLFFVTSRTGFDYLKQNVEKQKSLGVEAVEIVDRKTISEICPILNCEDVLAGSFGASDGFINPLAVMRGFTQKALEKGAKIRFEQKVFSIETKNGKVAAVKTSKGTIECEKIVLCSGAWAGKLAKTAGIDLPVAPQKRQIIWAKSATPLPENLPMVIDLETGSCRHRAQSANKTPLTKFFSLTRTRTKNLRSTRILTNHSSKKFMSAPNTARRFCTKQNRFWKNAAPDFMKTRPIITRFWAAAKSKAYTSRAVFPVTA
jgi:sarcosine oxidase, subunit beta